ncbi:MAG: Na+/H+ antiporter NhaC family protein [Leptolyngbyaceae cyanobacterium RM2_2_21]|nr:Na+/H+ antiporter NhaC family protein [Leptolyngbyaceae cyanobacterium RM2_2_21]
MDFGLGLLLLALTLTVTLGHEGNVLVTLLAANVILSGIYLRRGFSLKQLAGMLLSGAQQGLPVVVILLLIGLVIASWMAAGTVSSLVYYGISLIQADYFVLSAFLLTAAVSVLIGTSFGAVGTIGIALMIVAHSSQVNSGLAAGAIIAGAYVGDRCSPLSSSAHLVASLTQTHLYSNLYNMLLTSLGPLLISGLIYTFCPSSTVELSTNNPITAEILKQFQLGWVPVLPAIVVLGLACFRIQVRVTLLLSWIVAVAIALLYQGYAVGEIAGFMAGGYQLHESSTLHKVLQGGGLISMGRVCLMVVVSTALSGLLAGTQALWPLQRPLVRLAASGHLFVGTALAGLLSAAIGCTQTIAIVLTHQLMHKPIFKPTSVPTI